MVEEEKNNEAITEAVLFIAGRFLSLQELVMYTNINPLTLKEILLKLEEKYKNANSAFTLVVRGENYKLDVKKDYSWLVNKLASGKSEFTRAEQETLAIIAYKQPILQSVVVKIRGNKAYEHIKKLIELDLVKGRKIRHTLELTLSDNFYDYFNINKDKNADELRATVKSMENRNQGKELGADKAT
ncbi:MAG: SMC-Scp complex subunit ScpB [Candidatus Pacearchaeota archaeon]